MHTRTYLTLICLVSFPINCLILPNHSTFSKECTFEHPLQLVSIHLVHTTRIAVLFVPINQRSLWKTVSLFHRQHLCLPVLPGIRKTLSVWFQALGYLETGFCGQCQFLWFPIIKQSLFLGLVHLWSRCEKMKRRLCVPRSQAQRGQNSSVTLVGLGLCSTVDGTESGWENTLKAY